VPRQGSRCRRWSWQYLHREERSPLHPAAIWLANLVVQILANRRCGFGGRSTSQEPVITERSVALAAVGWVEGGLRGRSEFVDKLVWLHNPQQLCRSVVDGLARLM
jgi:hypothetical protein